MAVLTLVIPILWFAREREVSALRAELAEVRAHADEIERGLSIVSDRRPRRRSRRHLASVVGGSAAVVLALAGITPTVVDALS